MTFIEAARQMAVTNITPIPTGRWMNVTTWFFNGTNESTSPPNWKEGILSIINIYPDFLGPIAFLLIFLIPFGMIWMAHGNMKLLGILGLIVGVFVLATLPANFAAAAWICIVVAAAGILWGLFKQ